MSPVSRRRKRKPSRVASVEVRRAAPDGDTPLLMLPASVVAWLEERRSAHVGHHRMNGWKCAVCGLVTVCVDVHTGVTPMFLGCRRTPGCKGMATSASYPDAPLPPDLPQPGWEWYRPSAHEFVRHNDEAKEHVRKGGLLLRERTTT